MATFHQMPERTGLGVAPEQVVAIIESINAPNISVPGAGTSPAKAFIVGIRIPDGTFTVMLYMHLLDLSTAAIFAPDPQTTTLEGYPALESAAIHYVESMGFMLDNLNFRARSTDEQAKLAQSLPIFYDRPPPPVHGGGRAFGQSPGTGVSDEVVDPPRTPVPLAETLSADESQALARLLAAF